MSKDDGNIEWIALHLMPKLVQSGKFTLTTDENLSGTDIMKIKSYDIQSLSAKDAFMLTLCYKVKVYLTDDIDGSKEHCIALVVKVYLIFIVICVVPSVLLSNFSLFSILL